METSQNRVWRAASSFTGVAIGLAGLAALMSLPMDVERGIRLGCAIALVNGIASFVTLNWAFHKSNKVFFSAFTAGIFARLLILGAACFFVLRHPAFDLVSTLLTQVLATVFFLLLELEYLPKRVTHGL